MISAASIRRALSASEAIDHLRLLPSGWNYGRGDAPNERVIHRSRAILLMLLDGGGSDFEVFPEDDGGILIAAYRTNDRFEILARADGQLECTHDDEPTTVVDGLLALLEELRRHGWRSQRSSGSFTHAITALGNVDIRPSPFVIRQGVFQSSMQDAWPQLGVRYAIISPRSTQPEFVGSHPVFGEFRSQNLLELTS